MPAANDYEAAVKLDRRETEGREVKEEEKREEEGRKATEEEREVNEERGKGGVAKEAGGRESVGSLSGSRVSLQSQQSSSSMSEDIFIREN